MESDFWTGSCASCSFLMCRGRPRQHRRLRTRASVPPLGALTTRRARHPAEARVRVPRRRPRSRDPQGKVSGRRSEPGPDSPPRGAAHNPREGSGAGEDAGPGRLPRPPARALPLPARRPRGPAPRSGPHGRAAPRAFPEAPARPRGCARTTRVPARWGPCPDPASATADAAGRATPRPAEPQALPAAEPSDAAARARTPRASRTFPSRARPRELRRPHKHDPAARGGGHGRASVPGARPERPERTHQGRGPPAGAHRPREALPGGSRPRGASRTRTAAARGRERAEPPAPGTLRALASELRPRNGDRGERGTHRSGEDSDTGRRGRGSSRQRPGGRGSPGTAPERERAGRRRGARGRDPGNGGGASSEATPEPASPRGSPCPSRC